jgi:hypothetical protein
MLYVCTVRHYTIDPPNTFLDTTVSSLFLQLLWFNCSAHVQNIKKQFIFYEPTSGPPLLKTPTGVEDPEVGVGDTGNSP